MKLHQLRYLSAIFDNELNITAAANKLFTSQPGVSKQIRMLEDELGIKIFERSGKHLKMVTPAGQEIIKYAKNALANIQSIKEIAQEYKDSNAGSLSIATTHTQARYVLPTVIRQFKEKYPQVDLQLHQGSPMQISDLAAKGLVDFAIATEALEHFSDLIMMPCYHWNRTVIVPHDHELTCESELSLEKIAQYPILTYVFGFTGRSKLDKAFDNRGLKPNVVFTATDADVIKTYVRLGLGIGIIAKMSYDPAIDKDLTTLDTNHLFDPSTTSIGFRKGTFLRAYHYDFIQLFSSHLTLDIVNAVVEAKSNEAREKLFENLVLQIY